jgi:hypothetical protein
MKHRINQRKTKKSEWEIQKELAANEYNEASQFINHHNECIPKSLRKAFESIEPQAINKANLIK